MIFNQKSTGISDVFVASKREAIPPELEYFKSVYIPSNIMQIEGSKTKLLPGHLQIRGTDIVNAENVYGILTAVKMVLVKRVKDPASNKEQLNCFSFRDSQPYFGTSGLQCPTLSKDRRSVDFCRNCKTEFIATLILCDEDGNVQVNDEGKPINIFLRVNGKKYMPVSTYVDTLVKSEFEPAITPSTEDSMKWEKSNLNIKRVVTKISVSLIDNPEYGNVISGFELQAMDEIPLELVELVHNHSISDEFITEFKKKFDWTESLKSKGNKANSQYIPDASTPVQKPKVNINMNKQGISPGLNDPDTNNGFVDLSPPPSFQTPVQKPVQQKPFGGFQQNNQNSNVAPPKKGMDINKKINFSDFEW